MKELADFEVLLHPLESFRGNPRAQDPKAKGRAAGALDMAAATVPAKSRLAPFDREVQEISWVL